MTPDESKRAASNIQMIPVKFLSHFAQLCRESKERYEGGYEIPFAEEWFGLPSNEYNPGLAYAAMGICLSGYKNLPSNDYKYIRGTYEGLGCEDIDITSYYHLNDENYIAALDNVNIVSYALGHRTIHRDGEEVPLLIILIRGTSVSVEWNSNSNVANSVADGEYDVVYHEGFRKSAENAFAGMKAYIEKHRIDASKAVVWIVAHSRGASVANVVAAMFDEDTESGFAKDRIYSYNFSSSTTTRRPDANGPAFDNIFNVMNPEDYIPRIPPREWDFKRFGRDLYLPSVATDYANWRRWRREFEKRFREWTRVDFPAFHGNAATCGFERKVYNISQCAADMYCHERMSHGGNITFAQYFRIFTDIAAQHGMAGLAKDAEKLAKYGDGPFGRFLMYFMHNQIAGHDAPGAHQEEGYLIKLMLAWEMGIDIARPDNDRCDTRRFTVNGPMELLVRDGAGQIVAHIDNGKIDDALYAGDYIAMYYDKDIDASQVWVPCGDANGGYTLQITAAKDGGYDMAWADLDPMGAVLEQRFWADVPLKKGEAVTWSELEKLHSEPTHVASPGDDLSAEVSVAGVPDDDSVVRADENETLSYWADYGDSVLDFPAPKVMADALAARAATYGDHIAVEAYHDKELRFVGWYEGGELVSKDKTYVFRIERHRNLEARFERRRK